ncbi:MAG: acetoacetate metabolism regulatory protein AtoC [Candidatus Poribacteria bacterium]|nr:MAG: acetoacetate metabolism regulatory protein AtoC [Candidatus Poribacteria bacterium]
MSVSQAVEQRPLVLVVDDDPAEREQIARIFRREPVRVRTAANGEEALQVLEDEEVAVLLTDLKMPGMDGQELLRRAKEVRPDVQVVVITGYGSIEEAVEAMQAGAADFLQKPLDVQTTRVRVRKALEKHDLAAQNRALREQLDDLVGLENIIGRSPKMQEVFRKIRRVAPTNATVLILGESGTGKELVARAIHNLSPRRNRRFLAFNCAAVTRELVESELFGYVRGAFTGAVRDKPGYFEEANGGTLLLDEIGEMTLEAQAKLLRVLEEKEIYRVGGTRPIAVDVRILAATNRDLEEAVREGRFREDLYHRLKVFPIELPPLRERKEDIPLLVAHFLREACREYGTPLKHLEPAALEALQRYHWPGNVRELRNLISYLVLNIEGETIRREDLPEEIQREDNFENQGVRFPVGMSMDEIEREAILRTLEATGWNKTRAAQLLGIGLRTLYRKLERYGISGPSESEGSKEESE